MGEIERIVDGIAEHVWKAGGSCAVADFMSREGQEGAMVAVFLPAAPKEHMETFSKWMLVAVNGSDGPPPDGQQPVATVAIDKSGETSTTVQDSRQQAFVEGMLKHLSLSMPKPVTLAGPNRHERRKRARTARRGQA